MPDYMYNEDSPSTDYVVHTVPSQLEGGPSERLLYCDVSCFAKEMEDVTGSSLC